MSADSNEDDDDGPPPDKWWCTAYMRAVHDFEWLSAPDIAGGFFGHLDTISDFVRQRLELAKKAELYLVASFIGASLILAGGLPEDAQFSLFGFEGPSKIITIPLLAGLVAGVFSRYVQLIASVALISTMIDKVVTKSVPQGPEFVIARYDATYLWMNLMRKRVIGYQSPLAHTLMGGSFSIAGLLWFLLHTTVVIAAMVLAVTEASQTAGLRSFPFFIALMSLVMSTLSVLYLVIGFLVPVPYKMSDDMKKYYTEKDQALHGGAAPTLAAVADTAPVRT